MKDLISHGTPVHWFFQVVYPLFFHASYVFQDLLLLVLLFLITKKTPFSRSSLPVPVAVEQIQNVTVEEGRNVTKECNVTAGTPPRNYFWKNMKTGQVTEGKLLNIPNIRRNESGEYRCTANNTCGNESTGMFIDVHCKNLYNVFIRLSNVYYRGVFLGSIISLQSAASLAVGFLFSVLPNLNSTLILL